MARAGLQRHKKKKPLHNGEGGMFVCLPVYFISGSTEWACLSQKFSIWSLH